MSGAAPCKLPTEGHRLSSLPSWQTWQTRYRDFNRPTIPRHSVVCAACLGLTEWLSRKTACISLLSAERRAPGSSDRVATFLGDRTKFGASLQSLEFRMERSPSEVMLFPTCNAVSSLGDGRSNHQSQPRASPSLVSFPIILDHDDNNLEAGAAAGLYQSRCRTGNSINEVATFRERQTSCDSSSCTVCHCTRHSVDSLLTSCATRPVSNFRSTGNLSDHFSTRRSSLGKRPSLSSLPRGSGSSSNMHISASDSDLASLATEGASSTTAYDPMEEEFEDCKQARRFSRQWMRSVDRMSVPQTWGHSLENVSASVPAPIRAQFSEVCSLAEPDGSDGGSSSGRRTAKHIFQDLLVNCNGLLLAGASRAKQVRHSRAPLGTTSTLLGRPCTDPGLGNAGVHLRSPEISARFLKYEHS